MDQLGQLVREELLQPADSRVQAMAAALAERHGSASRAVLFYGSCLRERRLEGLMLDFYLIVSDYREAYDRRWLATANRFIPPNVFPFQHNGMTAKYAVLSEADFARECGPAAFTVSTAARFAQPSRLVWNADYEALEKVVEIVTSAAPTLLEWVLPCFGDGSPNDLWKQAFARTFAAELRAEREDRSASIVEADPERYHRFGLAALERIAARLGVGPGSEVPLTVRPDEAARWWRKMQRRGKWYSVARLAKASATFAGGPEYIAWKINRHAGTAIQLKEWQKRWPLLAAVSLAPKLIRSKAIR